MKLLISMSLLLVSLSIFAQMPAPGTSTEIYPHGKFPVQVDYKKLLGTNFKDNWDYVGIATDYPYNGKTITVQYPHYMKAITLDYKGKKVPGAFAIKYERYYPDGPAGGAIQFLMYQIFLYWDTDQNIYSWFIAKSDSGGTVRFYESDPLTERTLDPYIDFADGGPMIWRIDLLEFAKVLPYFEQNIFEELKQRTKQAIIDGMANPHYVD